MTVELIASPGGKATFDMGNVKGIPMTEVPATAGGAGIPAVDNGTYRAEYVIRPGDDFENGQVVGHFVSPDNVAATPVASPSKWTIDTKPRVAFGIDKTDLPADSASKARVKLSAKDANGNPVKGRHLKLTLATTDEYTGTVGAGDFGKDVGASVETRWRGETDSWGEVEFDYKAGFAAKTVILTAKDLDSGGASVDYITAYKEASIDIALTAPVNRAAARRGGMYLLKVEATRTELTADGRSRSVIRATLLDPNGKTVPGDPVSFSLSSENGTLRTISGTTDSSGTATAEYIGGEEDRDRGGDGDGDASERHGDREHHASLGRPGEGDPEGPSGDPACGREQPVGHRGEGDRHQRQPEHGHEGGVPNRKGRREPGFAGPGDGPVRRRVQPVHGGDHPGDRDDRGDGAVEGSHGCGAGEGAQRPVRSVQPGQRPGPGGAVAEEEGRDRAARASRSWSTRSAGAGISV